MASQETYSSSNNHFTHLEISYLESVCVRDPEAGYARKLKPLQKCAKNSLHVLRFKIESKPPAFSAPEQLCLIAARRPARVLHGQSKYKKEHFYTGGNGGRTVLPVRASSMYVHIANVSKFVEGS